jgi:hypothetical protein
MVKDMRKLMETRHEEDRRVKLHSINYIFATMDGLKKQLANLNDALLRPQGRAVGAADGQSEAEGQPALKLHSLPKSRPYQSVAKQVTDM